MARNQQLPDTATGGQGGFWVGLAPVGAGKLRQGLNMHVWPGRRQKRVYKKKKKSQMGNKVKKENLSNGPRHHLDFVRVT